jgi:hypothetical protein
LTLGLVVNIGRDERNLAPTFDHASSLGAHESDDQRSKRLESPDPGFRVEAYVQRPKVLWVARIKSGDLPQTVCLSSAEGSGDSGRSLFGCAPPVTLPRC